MEKPNEKNNQKESKQGGSSAFWQIGLPLLIFFSIFIVLSIFLVMSATFNESTFGIWVNISLMLVSLPLFIIGLFILFIQIVLIFGISKTNQLMPRYLRRINTLIKTLSRIIIRISSALLKSILFIDGLTTGFSFKKSNNVNNSQH